jgi:ATP-dependent DNA ligase
VYDAIGVGTGFIALPTRPVVIQDDSFMGRRPRWLATICRGSCRPCVLDRPAGSGDGWELPVKLDGIRE